VEGTGHTHTHTHAHTHTHTHTHTHARTRYTLLTECTTPPLTTPATRFTDRPRWRRLFKLNERLTKQYGKGCMEAFPQKSILYMKPEQVSLPSCTCDNHNHNYQHSPPTPTTTTTTTTTTQRRHHHHHHHHHHHTHHSHHNLAQPTRLQAHFRRFQLQNWMQKIGAQPLIVQGEIFQSFLLNAQKEVMKGPEEDVQLEIFLVNGKSVTVDICSTDQTDDVLEAVR
jgi:hypothetical protein